MRAVLLGTLGTVLATASVAAPLSPDTDRAFAVAFRIIREHHLLAKALEHCFLVMESSGDVRSIIVLDVRENHRPPRCKGDPMTAPRLFSLEIDMRTGKAKWDRIDDGNPDGEMRPIPRRFRP